MMSATKIMRAAVEVHPPAIYSRVGSIVKYSGFYDLVVKAARVSPDSWMPWQVDVISCDQYGNIEEGAWTRRHCTRPDRWTTLIREGV